MADIVTSFTLVWIKMMLLFVASTTLNVTSFTLVWIKITQTEVKASKGGVTSFTLVWIKMLYLMALGPLGLSHELHARVD